jgi:transcription-repair coupling factor (superfamily II helicase)
MESLLQRVPPRFVWSEIRFEIQPGQAVDDLRLWLIRGGYILDERVDEPGEAAIRGEVIDIFPADAEGPFRLESRTVGSGESGATIRWISAPSQKPKISRSGRLRR